MTNEIQIIKETEILEQPFLVYGTYEDPLILAADVARFINYAPRKNGSNNVTKMLQLVDEDEKVKIFCQVGFSQKVVNPQNQQVTTGGANRWFLTENGVYEVLMQANTEQAKKFKKQVKKVLHELRVNGAYIADNGEDDAALMAKAVLAAQRTLEAREQKIRDLEFENDNYRATIEMQNESLKESAPKVEYFDNVMQSKSTYTTTQMAKELGLRSANALHSLLSDKGIMFRQSGQWMMMAKYSELGYASTRTHSGTKPNGEPFSNTITVWTEKGRNFLHSLDFKPAEK